MSVDQAVSLAIAGNPRLKALGHDIAAAERGVASANALTNLSVTFTPGITRAGSDEELLVSQPLEINGTRTARGGIARARKAAVEAEALGELREAVYGVKVAYFSLARAQERKALAEDVTKLAAELHRIAQREFELGNRAGVDRMQTGLEANRAKQQAVLAAAEYESALAELNTELGRAPTEALVVTPLVFAGPSALSAEQLLKQALEGRSEVRLSQATQQGFMQEARLARAEGLPDLIPQFRVDSVTRAPRESGFGIGISIPILDYGSRRNRIKQAEEDTKAEVQRQKAVENRISQEVTQALTRLRAAESVLQTFEAGMLDEAKKLVQATQTGFRLGDTTLATVLEAQRTYRNISSEYIEALVSHAQALAQVERATGSIPASLLDQLRIGGPQK